LLPVWKEKSTANELKEPGGIMNLFKKVSGLNSPALAKQKKDSTRKSINFGGPKGGYRERLGGNNARKTLKRKPEHRKKGLNKPIGVL